MHVRTWQRLSRAAGVALVTHLVAGLAMWLVLRHGLASEPDLDARKAFLCDWKWLWIAGWVPWTLAALAMLRFSRAFREAHELGRAAQRIVLAAVAIDLTAQYIEAIVIPNLAGTGAPDAHLYLLHDRAAVLLTGFAANGLYTLGVLLMAWATRQRYSYWMNLTAAGVVLGGAALSITALVDSAPGMVASNVLLVPALLAWLFGVGWDAGQRT
jgi:hypothetical protein